MAVVRTLGKNTLGDNDKMKVAMRDYDMSTHDISTIFRSSVGVGMLVPLSGFVFAPCGSRLLCCIFLQTPKKLRFRLFGLAKVCKFLLNN